MRRTNIYLDDRQTSQLDERATAEGISRAELIRRLLSRELEGRAGRESDLAIIDASFGALADLDMPSRGEDERRRHLARVWDEG